MTGQLSCLQDREKREQFRGSGGGGLGVSPASSTAHLLQPGHDAAVVEEELQGSCPTCSPNP